jgi:hypothetical protein
VSWSAKSTGLLLASYANRDGTSIRPGLKLLMANTGRKKRAIQNNITELMETGFLIQTSNWTPAEQKAGKLANEYRLGLPSPGKPASDGVKGASGGDEGCTSKGASECTPPDQVSPDHLQSTIPRDKLAGAPHGGAPQPSLDDYEDEEEYVEDAVDGYDGCEESTALGMIANGVHPRAVINKILAERREAAAHRRRAA